MRELSTKLSNIVGRPLQVEHRPGYGWYIVDRGQTLMGFNTRPLLKRYIQNVELRGTLYTPTARETYGR